MIAGIILLYLLPFWVVWIIYCFGSYFKDKIRGRDTDGFLSTVWIAIGFPLFSLFCFALIIFGLVG